MYRPYALMFLYIVWKKKKKMKRKRNKSEKEKKKRKEKMYIEKERKKRKAIKGTKCPKVKLNKNQCISVVKWKENAWVCEKVRNG